MGRVQQGLRCTFFPFPDRVIELVDRFWPAIEWDFQHLLGVDAYDYFRETRPWSQFLRFFDRLLQVEGSAVVHAYLNDKDVIDQMAKQDPPKPGKPSLFGWTTELSALKDIQDQMIASRGGSHFVPRPDIPGLKERWRRKDTALTKTIASIIGSD